MEEKTPSKTIEGQFTKWFFIFMILGIALYGWYVVRPALYLLPKDRVINISGFQGKIRQDVSVETLFFSVRIKVPFEEALTWGKDSLLVYSNYRGAKILKLGQTFGTLQYAQAVDPTIFYLTQASVNKGILTIKTRINIPALIGVSVLGLPIMAVIAFALSVILTGSIAKYQESRIR